MSDDGDTSCDYRAWRKSKQEKRAKNRSFGQQVLEERLIPFSAHNGGAHLIIDRGPLGKIDYYPGTGLWHDRQADVKKRGIRTLLAHMGEKQ